eukprot:4123429-Amphidinium_carterae.1
MFAAVGAQCSDNCDKTVRYKTLGADRTPRLRRAQKKLSNLVNLGNGSMHFYLIVQPEHLKICLQGANFRRPPNLFCLCACAASPT